MKQLSEYETGALNFIRKHGISLKVSYVDGACPLFCDGKHVHGNRYRITLKRDGKRISFFFWNSFNDAQQGKSPAAYDVLACASSDITCPETFADFCAEFGYEEDSRRAETTFQACRKQAERLQRIFDDEVIQAELGTIN